jgi:hypothetical protein
VKHTKGELLMTKYKKYLREKGFKLDIDYPFLPFGNPSLECVTTHVDCKNLCIKLINHYVVGDSIHIIDRYGQELVIFN